MGWIRFYIEFNQINDNCCRYLSKAAWKKLKTINLGFGYSNSDWNKIGDRGCKHICEGGWPQIKAVGISIDLNYSDVCCVREEGCRSIAKLIEYLRILWCKITASQVNSIKSERLAMASWVTSMGISSVTINTRNRASFDPILIWLYILRLKSYIFHYFWLHLYQMRQTSPKFISIPLFLMINRRCSLKGEEWYHS